jgi:hypothetical protein
MNKLLFIIIAGLAVPLFLISSFHYLGASHNCPLCISNFKHLKFLVSALTYVITFTVLLLILVQSKLVILKDTSIPYFSGRAPPVNK